MSKKKTYRISTLGCRTNQYESSAYRSQLERLGFLPAEPGESADLCVVNTCTVTATADRDSKREVRRLLRENPASRVAVTGCAVDKSVEFTAEFQGISSVQIVPNKEKEGLMDQLFPELGSELPEFSLAGEAGQTRAFVKIQDGCNSFCTYCIIPYVRGRSRSRSLSEIIDEVQTLIASGYKEVVLTGINIGDFDGGEAQGHPPYRLSDLVRAVDALEGIERVRVSSIDPDEVDEAFLAALIEGKHTCPSMHIVLQSGSNFVLKRMNRKYTRQVFQRTIERVKAANPDFTFTTDVVVGFPGERDEDFQETLDVCAETQFAKVHVFPYSDRERTRAALYPDKIATAVIHERKQQLLRQAERCAHELRNQFLGRTMRVLTESRDERNPGVISGYTENFLPVVLHSGDLSANEIVPVMLENNQADGFHIGSW